MSNHPRGYAYPPGTTVVPGVMKRKPQPVIDLAAHDARVLAERKAKAEALAFDEIQRDPNSLATKLAAKAEAETVILPPQPPAPAPPPEVSPPPAEVPAEDPPPAPADLTPPPDIDLSEFPGAQPTTLSPAQKRAAAKAAQQS